MGSVAEHLKQTIHFENRAALLPIFDTERPIRATGDMLPWYTGKACEQVSHSHINMAVLDSRWEASEAFELDRSPLVAAWVKNDRWALRSRTDSGASFASSARTTWLDSRTAKCSYWN